MTEEERFEIVMYEPFDPGFDCDVGFDQDTDVLSDDLDWNEE